MDMSIFNNKSLTIHKQRNFFILLCLSSILINILLSIKITISENKIIVVPGISQQMTIGDSSVSESYITEMASMLLSLLLDLSESDIGFKKEHVFKYVTEGSYLEISKYFEEQEAKVRKFKIATYFTPKKFVVNTKQLSVVADGILHTRFGNDGKEDKNVRCELSLKYSGGVLRLSRFKVDEVKS